MTHHPLIPGSTLDVPIADIVLDDRLRVVDEATVQTLVESLQQHGRMLQPVLLTPAGKLVAGAHRLEAARRLGWSVVPATVLGDNADALLLAQVDENLIRKELNVLEQAEHLALRREILGRMGLLPPPHRPPQAKGATTAPFTTTADLGESAGLSQRSTKERLQIARNLSQDARDLLRDTPVAEQTRTLLDLSRLTDASEQTEVAARLADGRAKTVAQARSDARRVAHVAVPLPASSCVGPGARLIYGVDVMDGLRSVESASIHTVVTSPPYFGLRRNLAAQHPLEAAEIGHEATVDAYVARLVEVFREVRRVLRPDGTFWLNLGDTYAQGDENVGLGAKNLCMVPARVALALQVDGWIVRSMVPWLKPNGHPESASDRPTGHVEYVFLLTRSTRYFYDAGAVRVGGDDGRMRRASDWFFDGVRAIAAGESAVVADGAGEPTAIVASTAPSHDGHPSPFPEALVEPCVAGGTSAAGCCASCGAPRERVTARLCERCPSTVPAHAMSCPACGHVREWRDGRVVRREHVTEDGQTSGRAVPRRPGPFRDGAATTVGWEPSCACEVDADPVPCTVLDPFSGSGTTGAVALRMGRSYIGIDLNADYLALAEHRLARARG